jgi:hypothetical protein
LLYKLKTNAIMLPSSAEQVGAPARWPHREGVKPTASGRELADVSFYGLEVSLAQLCCDAVKRQPLLRIAPL